MSRTFTPDKPCRCGYDGTGPHRCHAGRPDPFGTGETGERWCTAEAVPRLQAYLPALPGCQLKVGVVEVLYCDEHHAEWLAERS